MILIKYKKTVLGWYNFEFTIFKYNINPETFRNITGVSEQTTLGTCELESHKVDDLIRNSKHIGFANGWELVQNDGILEVKA